jgi:tetratricopeptide (TPR) repeat protein
MRYRALPWFTVFVLGCSTALAETGGRQISSEELLAGTALGLDHAAPAIITGDEVMALSDDMRAFLEEHVGRRAGNPIKLRQLSDAIFNKKVFGLEYDETTRTSAETFAARAGNCLSFTFMFVVLARGVGLDASFQEVEIPPEWTFTRGTYILNRHINIFVDFKVGVIPAKVVDFNIADFRADYDMDIISDQRALAHFFNNLGAQFMQQGDTTAAFHAFKRAIVENDASFAPSWDSLGTLYARSGLDYHAEAAFLQALAIDRSDLTAMNNLTVLYDRRGEPELARRYRNKVNSHRNRNPYYRFQLARMAYHVEAYDQAIDHLKYAVRRHKEDDRICALLGLVYFEMGDEKKSRQWMARAEEYAQRDSMKKIYSGKIDRLMAASRSGRDLSRPQ